MEIQQGNLVTQETLSQLKPGMTRDQVRYLLGSPLITDVFHADRWDYIFTRQRENTSLTEQRLVTLYFDNNTLRAIEGDVVPAAAASAKN